MAAFMHSAHAHPSGHVSWSAGETPSMKDWETHLTTIFPEVRLKRYMEMRGADGGAWSVICALPALWVGLLYDQCAPLRDMKAFMQLSLWL